MLRAYRPPWMAHCECTYCHASLIISPAAADLSVTAVTY